MLDPSSKRQIQNKQFANEISSFLSEVTLRDKIKSEKIRKQWKVEDIIDDIKIIYRNGTNMFLGCQKIDYHANRCNINPKEKEI